MIELILNPCLLYRYNTFNIVGLQINNNFMLAINIFNTIEKELFKMAKKLRIKKQVSFLPKMLIKFNIIWI